jgi:hypothetical protein
LRSGGNSRVRPSPGGRSFSAGAGPWSGSFSPSLDGRSLSATVRSETCAARGRDSSNSNGLLRSCTSGSDTIVQVPVVTGNEAAKLSPTGPRGKSRQLRSVTWTSSALYQGNRRVMRGGGSKMALVTARLHKWFAGKEALSAAVAVRIRPDT